MTHTCHGICTLSPLTTWLSPDNAICKSTQHHTSKVLRLPGHVQSAAPATKNERHFLKTMPKNCARTIFYTFWNRFEYHKVTHLPRKMALSPRLKPSKMRGVAASHIGTAMPQQHQRIERKHVGSSKWTFCARIPQISTFCSYKIGVCLRIFHTNPEISCLKIDVSCEVSVNFQHMSQNATPAMEFASTWRSAENAIRKKHATQHATQHVWSAALATQNEDEGLQSRAAPATKNATHLLKTTQKYCACRT